MTNRSQFPDNQKTISNVQEAEINNAKRKINISKWSLSVQNLCKSQPQATYRLFMRMHRCRNLIIWETTQQTHNAITPKRKSYSNSFTKSIGHSSSGTHACNLHSTRHSREDPTGKARSIGSEYNRELINVISAVTNGKILTHQSQVLQNPFTKTKACFN